MANEGNDLAITVKALKSQMDKLTGGAVVVTIFIFSWLGVTSWHQVPKAAQEAAEKQLNEYLAKEVGQDFTKKVDSLKDEFVSVNTAGAVAARRIVPPGTIVAWYAGAGPIPVGWAICDGTNGTPNLKDKFIVGTSDKSKVGMVVGSSTLSIPQLTLSTGGTDTAALREENGNGVVNHQAAPGHDNLVHSYTRPLDIQVPTPPSVAIMYLMKL